MAEVKSSLEIALERAAALAGEGKADTAKQEAADQGKVWARKVLNGDLPAHGLSPKIASLSKAAQAHARRAAADHLLDKLPRAWFLAGPALEVLAAPCGAEALVASLGQVIGSMEQAVNLAESLMSGEMAKVCQEQGISGSALAPNPRACEHYEKRIKQALEAPQKELNRLRAELISCFAVEGGNG